MYLSHLSQRLNQGRYLKCLNPEKDIKKNHFKSLEEFRVYRAYDPGLTDLDQPVHMLVESDEAQKMKDAKCKPLRMITEILNLQRGLQWSENALKVETDLLRANPRVFPALLFKHTTKKKR